MPGSHTTSTTGAAEQKLAAMQAIQRCRCTIWYRRRSVATVVMTQDKLAELVKCMGRAVGRIFWHRLTAMLVCQGTPNHLSGHIPPQEA